MFEKIEELQVAIEEFVQQPDIRHGTEPAYHIVQANTTPSYKDERDGLYIMVSDSYLKQQGLQPVYTKEVTR